MTRPLLAAIWILSSGPVLAQMQPSDQTTQIVVGLSETFLDQLVEEDFEAERAFLSERLARRVSSADWRATRQHVIDLVGATPRYAIHGLTYYQQEQLLAAVDFSAPGDVQGTLVCGFMLWELPEPNTIGLLRFEQNVVETDTFRSMPLQIAAETMSNWRCPVGAIEAVLGVSVQ